MAPHRRAAKAMTGGTTTWNNDGDGRHDDGKGQHGNGRHDNGDGQHDNADKAAAGGAGRSRGRPWPS